MTGKTPSLSHDRISAVAADLRAFNAQLRRRMRENADAGDLSPSQVTVLLRLEKDGPATISALSRAEGVRSQSMGATVSTLEAANLVCGKPDPSDKRQTIISLTENCRQWLAEGRAAREDWLSKTIEARFRAQEQEELEHAIRLLKRLLEP